MGFHKHRATAIADSHYSYIDGTKRDLRLLIFGEKEGGFAGGDLDVEIVDCFGAGRSAPGGERVGREKGGEIVGEGLR